MSVYMEDLDAFTYRHKVGPERAPMLIPAGSIEQHGRHMPLGVDVMLARAMAGETAERVGALVAAPIVYGYKSQQRSGGGNHLTGTTSLDGGTVIAIARSLILEFARHGVRRIAFVNGHFENSQFLYEGADLAVQELQRTGEGDMTAVLLSYWDFVDNQTIEQLYPEGFTGWDIEHGGVLETSLMLHLFPERVDMSKLTDMPPAQMPNYDVLPARPEFTPESGCLSSGVNATAEKGKLLLDTAASGMSKALIYEFKTATG